MSLKKSFIVSKKLNSTSESQHHDSSVPEKNFDPQKVKHPYYDSSRPVEYDIPEIDTEPLYGDFPILEDFCQMSEEEQKLHIDRQIGRIQARRGVVGYQPRKLTPKQIKQLLHSSKGCLRV